MEAACKGIQAAAGAAVAAEGAAAES
jgi:hypothetical protein